MAKQRWFITLMVETTVDADTEPEAVSFAKAKARHPNTQWKVISVDAVNLSLIEGMEQSQRGETNVVSFAKYLEEDDDDRS